MATCKKALSFEGQMSEKLIRTETDKGIVMKMKSEIKELQGRVGSRKEAVKERYR